MNGRLIQVLHGEATYKCDEGHIFNREVENPFDPNDPAVETECLRCETSTTAV